MLDDLHWAAEPTLQMLRHVLRSDRELNLLVIGTYRDTEGDRTHPLGALLADLRRTEGVHRIALRGLDGDGVADLVERASGHALSDQARDLATAVHAETGGNPFFAIEVLLSLAERGAIYQESDGNWRADVSIEDLGIPEGVTWRGQLFGNVIWHGPTESFLAGIAPLAGHADELDDLLSTALLLCEELHSPVNAMYARIFGACGLRTRDRAGDRERSDDLMTEAIEIGDRIGAGIALAARNGFLALTR